MEKKHITIVIYDNVTQISKTGEEGIGILGLCLIGDAAENLALIADDPVLRIKVEIFGEIDERVLGEAIKKAAQAVVARSKN